MSLPLKWIDRIFEKLTMTYGRDFMDRWKGLSTADVKTDWANELAGFERWGEAIAYALENLPASKPPTVLEFREIARKAPKPDRPALPEPKPDPERLRVELDKLETLRRGVQVGNRVDHKAWARRLIARHEAGEILKPYTLKCAQAALRTHLQPAQEA